jgi:hypothetical protein
LTQSVYYSIIILTDNPKGRDGKVLAQVNKHHRCRNSRLEIELEVKKEFPHLKQKYPTKESIFNVIQEAIAQGYGISTEEITLHTRMGADLRDNPDFGYIWTIQMFEDVFSSPINGEEIDISDLRLEILILEDDPPLQTYVDAIFNQIHNPQGA